MADGRLHKQSSQDTNSVQIMVTNLAQQVMLDAR